MKIQILKIQILMIVLFLSVSSLFSQNANRNLVIVEDFTATWCGYCPVAAKACDELVENGISVGVVAYHGSDDYSNSESEDRIDYYDVWGFPTVYIDGVIETGVSGDDMYNLYLMYVNQRLAITTPITVELTNVVFSGNTFTADVVCEAVGTISATDLVLHASLSESHIPEVWMDDTQELNFVERQMFPDAQGTSIDLVNNTTQTVSIEFTLDSTWIPELCEVVVFVQDVSDKEIYNAAKIEVEELTELPDAIVTVYDTDNLPMEGASVVFGDLQGTTNTIGEVVFADLESGVYTYNATKEGFLPINDAYAVMQVDDKDISITLSEAILLVNEDFSGNIFPPNDWTIENGHEENWNHTNTNYAGGTPAELDFFSNPQFIGYSEFVSPFFDVSGYTNFSLMYRQSISVMNGTDEFALSVLASSDGVEWETLYYISNLETWIPAEQLTVPLIEDYSTAGQIKIKFRVEVFSEKIFYWDIDDVWIIGEISTSVPENKMNDIIIYPNPAKNKIYIENLINASIEIYSISGQLIIEKHNISGSYTLDISAIEKGTYIIKVLADEKSMTSEIIIVN